MLSMVMPTYSLTEDLAEMAINTALTYRSQIDELVISEDGGKYSKELQTIADVYIFNKQNQGFTKNVNQGWKIARGDFVMIVNSDASLYEGNLKDLCLSGKVTSPEIVNQNIPFLAGPCWCAAKEVTKQRGYLIEAMHTYSSDSEYDMRVRDIFVKVPTVRIYHEMAQTVKAAGLEGALQQGIDRNAYELWKQNQK